MLGDGICPSSSLLGGGHGSGTGGGGMVFDLGFTGRSFCLC